MTRLSASLFLVLFVLLGASSAEEPPNFHQEQLDFFETKIRPVLVEHCYRCHSSEAKILKGGLRLDHRNGLLEGGDSGPSVIPGKPKESILIQSLKHEDLKMPPKGKLPDSVIQDFEKWVAMGAPDPRTPDVVNRKPKSIDIEAGRKFWAFQPVTDPPLPKVKSAEWPRDSIDYFVLAKLEEKGLKPVADADRYTWLRRVTLDLTGLPPSIHEIDDFIRDQSPQAREKVVDRLLASRAYGERWARHWLDLTGYADMMGTSNAVFAEFAWRYRDYVIEAFHKDKPFDRFIREQIAGDLMKADTIPERAENITATGFLMVGDVEIVEPDKAKMEADHIDTQITKIGTAFLGMTLGCVRCHDHKFDPITLTDYYGIAGMLRSSPSTHKIPFGVWSSLNYTELPETPEQKAERLKLEAEHEQKIKTMKAERSNLTEQKKIIEADLAKAKDGKEKEALTRRSNDLGEQIKKLNAKINHAEFFRSKAPRAFAMRDGNNPSDMPIYIRGNPYAKGKIVPRGAIQVMSWADFPKIPKEQSGRLQLADWLVDKRNPLTARVTVNRIWQKLFGEGLVRSVDYFGARGEAPSHPELLDHLASRFMDHGWSQKQLIRSLVLTRTYGLSSENSTSAMKVDPDNRLLWRMNRQRLEAEAIRDSLLAVSGELQPSQGGPALVLEEPENCNGLVKSGVNPPFYVHRKPRANEEYIRTIYLPVMRNGTTPNDRIRKFFDFVNPAQIAGQRSQTVVPTQALFLMNNGLLRKRAMVITDKLISQCPDTEERLNRLWLAVYNRPITDAERHDARSFLAELSPLVDGKESLLWQELCHGLLASNEFIFRF